MNTLIGRPVEITILSRESPSAQPQKVRGVLAGLDEQDNCFLVLITEGEKKGRFEWFGVSLAEAFV